MVVMKEKMKAVEKETLLDYYAVDWKEIRWAGVMVRNLE